MICRQWVAASIPFPDHTLHFPQRHILGSPSGHCFLDSLEQFGGNGRFDEISDVLGAVGSLVFEVRLGVARDNQDLYSGVDCANLLSHVDTVHLAAERMVGDEHLGPKVLGHGDRLGAVDGNSRLKTVERQQSLQRFAAVLFIIDDQDLRHARFPVSSCGRAFWGSARWSFVLKGPV